MKIQFFTNKPSSSKNKKKKIIQNKKIANDFDNAYRLICCMYIQYKYITVK